MKADAPLIQTLSPHFIAYMQVTASMRDRNMEVNMVYHPRTSCALQREGVGYA